MAKNTYECMFILDSNKYARDPGGVSAGVAKMIEDVEGTVQVSRLWNEQKLAYPINGAYKGTYWLTYFDVDSSKLDDFNRACKLNEAVHRHLCLKVDPRLVGALVAHARGERTEEPAAEAEAETAAAE